MQKKHLLLYIILGAFVTGSCVSISTPSTVTPHVTIRSQGVRSSRHITKMINNIYRDSYTGVHGFIEVNTEWDQSFRSKELNHCLFGNADICKTVSISGSSVANRNQADWLADYFYLPTDFQSYLSFTPRIDSLTIDPFLFFDLSAWSPGLYFSITFPIVHTRWDLNFQEYVTNPGSQSYEAGYFTSDVGGTPRNELLKNFTQYAQSTPVPIITNESNIIFQPLTHAQIRSKKNIKTRVADVRTTLGWDIINSEHARIKMHMQGAAPTGNKPEGIYLFEAIAGNSHHWELGTGLSGQIYFLQDKERERCVAFVFDGTITHLFGKRHTRTFDLLGNPLSRYVLAQKMTNNVVNLQTDVNTPAFQFAKEFAPLANLSTMEVDVKVSLQVDISCMLHYSRRCWDFDVGYNYWAKGCETIRFIPECAPLSQQSWAVKGDAHVFGYTQTDNSAVPLSATEQRATIHSGTNQLLSSNTALIKNNAGIDSPAPAFNGSTVSLLTAPSGTMQIQTSAVPHIISLDDVGIVATRSRTNSIFGQIAYTSACPHRRWTLFGGIGGQAEFAHKSDESCKRRSCAGCPGSCSSTCINCSVSQWSVWVKGGAFFD